MALDYNFYSDAQWSEGEILEKLKSLGLKQYQNENIVNGTGIHCSFGAFFTQSDKGHKPFLPPSYISENFFPPTFSIWMNVDKFDDHDEGLKNVIKVAKLVLKSTQSNGVLLFNGEYVYLYRKDGKLYINITDPLTWKPELRKILDIPFEEKKIDLVK